MDQCLLIRAHNISLSLKGTSDISPVSHVKCVVHICVCVCVCLKVWAGCRQWPLGNQGALCHASINVWHCVSWDDAWLVYEASKNDEWVMASRVWCGCVCVRERVVHVMLCLCLRVCICRWGLETQDSTVTCLGGKLSKPAGNMS